MVHVVLLHAAGAAEALAVDGKTADFVGDEGTEIGVVDNVTIFFHDKIVLNS